MKYQKIENIYKRSTEGDRQIIEGAFTSPEVLFTQGLTWLWTEKVDGTNIRVCWDGYRVSIKGRTDNAQIQPHLLEYLQQTFCTPEAEEIFENIFGMEQAILFGEGYGPKIQGGGGLYRDTPGYIMFDVATRYDEESAWRYRMFSSVYDISKAFGVPHVPVIGQGPLGEAVELVKKGFVSQVGEKHPPEGLVCRPLIDLYSCRGERLIVKIKGRDFGKTE